MRRFLLPFLLVAPLAAQRPATAPPAAGVSPGLPVDTSVHHSRLANGLQYTIRHNAYPEHRLELRLVVRAGSVLEDDDQRGLAHFIEHMGFNGTKHFARGELVSQLEAMGVRFGADLNAQTGFDETTYILPVPSDTPELVRRAFDILEDWAMGANFDADAIEHEHGVIMGEWRSGLGAGSRLTDKLIPVLFQGSLYAKRLPIGDTTTIMGANAPLLRRFYHDWYRPNLMAVIAVGDYPVDSLRALITAHFAGMKNPAPERARTDVAVPLMPGTRVLIATDPEITTESISLSVRRPSVSYRTEADERRNLIHSLFSIIASERLDELSRKPDAPFVGAGFGPSTFIRDLQTFSLGVGPKEGRSAAAFEATLRELRRFQQHGVLPVEVERAKAGLLRGRERAASETGKTASVSLVGPYVSAFLYGYSTPSAQQRFQLAQRLLPLITVAEINTVIRDVSRGADRFVMLQAPEAMQEKLPPRDTLLAILARSDTATVPAWVDATVSTELVPNPPTPGRVVAETSYAALGITEWKLSNGIRVLLKPTDYKKDQILIFGESGGGMSLLADEQLLNGAFATVVVEASGAGDFDALSLERKTTGRIASVSPQVDETSQGFSVTTAPNDLDVALQVLWLQATSPRLDTGAVRALINQIRTGLANRDADPATVFADSISAIMSRHSRRAEPITAARLDTVDPARALALYRDWFGDFGQFTFVMVGNIDLAAVRPLIERWIGGLPSRGNNRNWRVVDSLPPVGVINTLVLKGKEPVADQVIFFTGPATETDELSKLAATAAGQILEARLLDSLRQGMGATYGASASTGLGRVPQVRYQSVVSFQAAPALADTLWKVAQRIITALRTTGPTSEELQKIIAQMRREFEVSTTTNQWWLSTITDYVNPDGVLMGYPLANSLRWSERLDALTTARVQEAARKYFDPTRVARFVLLPEK